MEEGTEGKRVSAEGEAQKREADSESEDLVASKKPRTEASTVEDGNAAKEEPFDIEADAAEDKGSRHTMEDSWVVLLDASLDYPGKLRFFSYFISFFFSKL